MDNKLWTTKNIAIANMLAKDNPLLAKDYQAYQKYLLAPLSKVPRIYKWFKHIYYPVKDEFQGAPFIAWISLGETLYTHKYMTTKNTSDLLMKYAYNLVSNEIAQNKAIKSNYEYGCWSSESTWPFVDNAEKLYYLLCVCQLVEFLHNNDKTVMNFLEYNTRGNLSYRFIAYANKYTFDQYLKTLKDIYQNNKSINDKVKAITCLNQNVYDDMKTQIIKADQLCSQRDHWYNLDNYYLEICKNPNTLPWNCKYSEYTYINKIWQSISFEDEWLIRQTASIWFEKLNGRSLSYIQSIQKHSIFAILSELMTYGISPWMHSKQTAKAVNQLINNYQYIDNVDNQYAQNATITINAIKAIVKTCVQELSTNTLSKLERR